VTFDEARAAFPVLERFAYLNAGTTGPLARATVAAMDAELQADLERGRVGQTYFEHMLELRGEVRTRIAALLGVQAADVALTTSTTDSCNIVLSGLELHPGDEVVTSDEEHFGLLGALHASAARVVVAPADRVLEAVTAQTRLVAISHISWVTGNVIDPGLIQAETGLPVLVDGAQSVGAIPVDAGGFDFYTVSCQKWLCGPDPMGALYVRDPEGLRVALPTYFSQESYEPDGTFTPSEGATRYDSGWHSVPYLAGLIAALDGAPDWRFERAREAADRCHALLAEGYRVVTRPGASTLVSFEVDGDAEEVALRLYEHGVVVRNIPKTDLVRVSCGYWTSDEDLDRLLTALDA
jgi:selenocysteine lyase/cysteine desulfurase